MPVPTTDPLTLEFYVVHQPHFSTVRIREVEGSLCDEYPFGVGLPWGGEFAERVEDIREEVRLETNLDDRTDGECLVRIQFDGPDDSDPAIERF